MKKIYLFLFLAASLLVGCKNEEHHEQKQEDRFEEVYHQNNYISYVYILEDKQTGVQYLVVYHGYGTGVTKLE